MNNIKKMLKYGYHMCVEAMVSSDYTDPDYTDPNFLQHASHMWKLLNNTNINQKYKNNVVHIMKKIQYATSNAERGHYYGKLNEAMNTIDNEYIPIV